IVGIQDMGAAGLTCSTTEMAAKSGMGIVVDLDKVPQREVGMTPYEILLSESQERMLLVATPDNVAAVQAVFAKWDLDAPVIGEVVEGGRARISFKGQVVVDIPVDAVVNLCPAYERPIVPPPPPPPAPPLAELPQPVDLAEALLRVLGSPTIADKQWVFRQYDHMVQVNTVFLPGADAAVLRIKGSKEALAVTLDGNALYTRLDPRTGARIAVAEACRNLAAVGARPIGVTNCLNFGNPEKPEVMGQFEQAVTGMAEACRTFGIPVTGGNVSFYNETEGLPIHPTPVLGIVGLIDDVGRAVSPGFKAAGDAVVLLGESFEELGGSEYLKVVHGVVAGVPPAIDLELERRTQETLLEAIGAGLIRSAHDLSEGGLAVALAESAFHSARNLGCEIGLEGPLRDDVLLFAESQSRVLVTCRKGDLAKLLALSARRDVPAQAIGRVGGPALKVGRAGRTVLRVPVEEAFRVWKDSLPAYFKAAA
ncbi:MAG TPA: AIR synthase-related protein, partial [Acidobacteriota bacterium]|nr:AIR synthase-related protein [Acidobacteriota bacterium]